MSLNLDRISNDAQRAKALVFALTGVCEISRQALGTAYDELGHAADAELSVDAIAPEYVELRELLTRIEHFAVSTRIALGSLAVRT